MSRYKTIRLDKPRKASKEEVALILSNYKSLLKDYKLLEENHKLLTTELTNLRKWIRVNIGSREDVIDMMMKTPPESITAGIQ